MVWGVTFYTSPPKPYLYTLLDSGPVICLSFPLKCVKSQNLDAAPFLPRWGRPGGVSVFVRIFPTLQSPPPPKKNQGLGAAPLPVSR